MININLIRENPELVKNGIKKKFAEPELVDNFLEVDSKWKLLKKTVDDARSAQKLLGQDKRDEARRLKDEIIIGEEKLTILEQERDFILSQIPNLPEDDVPIGTNDSDNLVLKTVGCPPEFNFTPKDYIEIAGDKIDTDRASKIAGSRFGYILDEIAELDMALFRLGIDTLLPYGFRLVIPPVMIKSDMLRRMGKSKFIDGGDAFHIAKDDLYLVGSSEQSIAPIFADECLSTLDKPIRFLGFSACFRREAGSYGKDTKGILRVHQFNKLEMFIICRPKDSKNEHEFLLARQEELMQKIELPYRVVVNSTGDMGFDTSKQYDIEAWIPSQQKYRETHSCSNTTDFQSRGLNITYKTQEGGKEKRDFVHTLNATAFSERPLLAILENFQNEDGSVTVPESLKKYLRKDIICCNG